MAGLVEKVGVHDDAVALIAVTDGDELAILVGQVVRVCVLCLDDGRIGEVHRIATTP